MGKFTKCPHCGADIDIGKISKNRRRERMVDAYIKETEIEVNEKTFVFGKGVDRKERS